MVLVDTPIWSEFFRRSSPRVDVHEALGLLIDQGEAILIGPVRQEILCGIKNISHYRRLRASMRAFPDALISAKDYEHAAAMFNKCRNQGVQGSNTDFLICAISVRLGAAIFTLDRDFHLFATLLPIKLHTA